MKYLIIGAGGTGGSIGGFLANAGKDVTFIARGKHLEAIEQRGLLVLSPKGKLHIKNAKAVKGDFYDDKADVIFVCVKCYSIDDILPYIEKAAHKDTVVIPIMNAFGWATRIAEKIKAEIISLGSCIYIASDISNYGEITQRSDLFKIVYGIRENDLKNRERKELLPLLKEIKYDLLESGIETKISKNINEDVFKKFSFVSPMSAVGAYFDVNAGQLQLKGEPRDTFIELIKEVEKVAKAEGINLKDDIVKKNLDILSTLLPNMTSAFQKDLKKGERTEMDGLILDVLFKAEKFGIDLPVYRKIADELIKRYGI